MRNLHGRRGPLAVSVLITSALAVSGCGGGSDTGSTPAAGGTGSGECEDVELRLTHQWPAASDGEGDFRSVLAQRFADQVEENTDGSVAIQIYPANSLVGAIEQYDSMMAGTVDMSVFPLAYAGGQVPAFDITAMPAVIRNHAESQAWEEAEIGQRIEAIMEENGVKPLTWVWNAGAIGTKGEPIVSPDDIRPGMTIRSGFAYHDRMLEDAGAGVTGMPSSEIYTAMQTGVLDGAVTSTGSFASYSLQEQLDTYTSPADNTFWFLFEPLIVSTESFNSLCSEQQQVFEEVGTELQDFAYTASEEDDAATEAIMAEAGVEVSQMDDAAFEQWRELAEGQWADFAADVPEGQELLDLAQQATE